MLVVRGQRVRTVLPNTTIKQILQHVTEVSAVVVHVGSALRLVVDLHLILVLIVLREQVRAAALSGVLLDLVGRRVVGGVLKATVRQVLARWLHLIEPDSCVLLRLVLCVCLFARGQILSTADVSVPTHSCLTVLLCGRKQVLYLNCRRRVCAVYIGHSVGGQGRRLTFTVLVARSAVVVTLIEQTM